MSGESGAERINNDDLELSEEELLGLHDSFHRTTNEKKPCDSLSCDKEARVDAYTAFGIPFTFCVRCLPRFVYTW